MAQTAPGSRDATTLLRRVGAGDKEAVDGLLPLVYDELRALASRSLGEEGPGHTLQTTALVHEAYLRLVDQRDARWADRTHFFAVAATCVRRILIDHARARRRLKRGGRRQRVSLGRFDEAAEQTPDALLAIDEALARLERFDPRKARVVELRYFAGLGIDEVSEALGVSRATVKRDWAAARAWLQSEIAGESGAS